MRVLAGLKARLLAPELVAAFVGAFQEQAGHDREARIAALSRHARKRAEVERKIARIMRAIEDGLYDPR